MNGAVARTVTLGFEAVKPLFALGDSHTVGLQGLLLRDAGTNQAIGVGQSFYIPGMRAFWALTEEGQIHPSIVSALAAACVIGHNHPPKREDLGIAHANLILAPHIWAQERHVLFVIGEIDARWVIRSIPHDAGLELPFEADLSALPDFTPAHWVPAAALREKTLYFFRPLFKMLVRLQEIGLPLLALASVTPPTPDDDEYFKYHGFPSRARTRYGVHMFVNSILRSFCEQTGITFVDVWEKTTMNNVVKPGWLIDGLHFSAPGNAMILAEFMSATMRAAAAR